MTNRSLTFCNTDVYSMYIAVRVCTYVLERERVRMRCVCVHHFVCVHVCIRHAMICSAWHFQRNSKKTDVTYQYNSNCLLSTDQSSNVKRDEIHKRLFKFYYLRDTTNTHTVQTVTDQSTSVI